MFKAAAHLSTLVLATIGLAGMLGFAQPAAASGEGDISTRAFTNHAVQLYTHDGWRGDIIGDLPGGIALQVDRCAKLWCEVHGRFGHGWVFRYSLSFGQGPNSIWWPPVERHGPYHPWRFLGY